MPLHGLQDSRATSGRMTSLLKRGAGSKSGQEKISESISVSSLLPQGVCQYTSHPLAPRNEPMIQLGLCQQDPSSGSGVKSPTTSPLKDSNKIIQHVSVHTEVDSSPYRGTHQSMHLRSISLICIHRDDITHSHQAFL